jgi:hypothetical protein
LLVNPRYQRWLDGLTNNSSNNSFCSTCFYTKTLLPFFVIVARWSLLGGKLAATFYVYEFDERWNKSKISRTSGKKHFLALGGY